MCESCLDSHARPRGDGYSGCMHLLCLSPLGRQEAESGLSRCCGRGGRLAHPGLRARGWGPSVPGAECRAGVGRLLPLLPPRFTVRFCRFFWGKTGQHNRRTAPYVERPQRPVCRPPGRPGAPVCLSGNRLGVRLALRRLQGLRPTSPLLRHPIDRVSRRRVKGE